MGTRMHTCMPEHHACCIQLWRHAQLAGWLELSMLLMQDTESQRMQQLTSACIACCALRICNQQMSLGMGSCILQAAATRALQRLHDIPELKEALSSSTARDLQPDASMSPAHSSQLNSSTATPAAAAFIAAATAGSPQAAAPLQSPAAAAAASAPAQVAAAMQLSPRQTGQTAAPAGGNAVGVQNVGSAPGPGFTVSGSQPEDLKQLAQVLTAGSSRWLREKAAAAVEQLATDNPAACRCALTCLASPCLAPPCRHDMSFLIQMPAFQQAASWQCMCICIPCTCSTPSQLALLIHRSICTFQHHT